MTVTEELTPSGPDLPGASTFVRTGPPPEPRPPEPRKISSRKVRGDRIFHGGSYLSGVIVLAIMVAVGLFLSIEAWSALSAAGPSFFTTAEWETDRGKFGIASIMLGTALVALVAVGVAMPIAMGTSLFITNIAPPKVRGFLVAMVDLMAAVPSIVYGLWGLFFFQGMAVDIARWINTWLGWMPWFSVSGADPNSPNASLTVYSASIFVAGIVVALMVMPIQTSVMREVFSQVPDRRARGRLRTGWHPMGRHPHRVAALRPRRHHRRHHARHGPGPRRDHRRRPDPVVAVRHQLPRPRVGRQHRLEADRRPLQRGLRASACRPSWPPAWRCSPSPSS